MKKVYISKNVDINTAFIEDSRIVDNPDDADIILFGGNTDVSAEICDEDNIKENNSNYRMDVSDICLFNRAMDKRKAKLILGINRGAGLVCSMSGGKILQGVDNHKMLGLHLISDGKDSMLITSNHTQLQYPYNLKKEEYEVLFWAVPERSDKYIGKSDTKIANFKECEIVLYKNNPVPCLAIQGNPDKMNSKTVTVQTINKIIDAYVK